MNDKIELFQEILAGDPTSKLFYPLAKLYAAAGRSEEAALTLRQGLSRHPDHMEARLALIDVLTALGRRAEAGTEAASVAASLAGHPEFWRLWSASIAQSSADCALAIDFVAAHLGGRCPTFLGLLTAGLAPNAAAPAAEEGGRADAVPRAKDPADPARQIKAALDAESPTGAAAETAEASEEASLRTRTMADLLFAQEDYAGALDIYAELLAAAPQAEKAELSERVSASRSRLGQTPARGAEPPEPSSEAETRTVVSTLSALAERLEARARARSSGDNG